MINSFKHQTRRIFYHSLSSFTINRKSIPSRVPSLKKNHFSSQTSNPHEQPTIIFTPIFLSHRPKTLHSSSRKMLFHSPNTELPRDPHMHPPLNVSNYFYPIRNTRSDPLAENSIFPLSSASHLVHLSRIFHGD